jgi:hypothetical protein
MCRRESANGPIAGRRGSTRILQPIRLAIGVNHLMDERLINGLKLEIRN